MMKERGSNMLNYILKRMGLMVITFFVAIFLYFMFIKLIPDNHVPPIGSDNQYYENLVKKEGWDKPIPVQFAYWIRNIVQSGSFGFSKDYQEDVSVVYFSRIPATLKVNVIPYLVSIPLAILIGIVAALHKNKFLDHVISVGIIVFISVPTFVTYVLAQYLFYFRWRLVPDFKVATASEIALYGTWYGVA